MRKSVLKPLLAVVLALLLAASIFLVNLIWFRPFSLNLFYEKVFVEFMLDQPELLTAVGIAEQFGWRRHNAHLDDASIGKMERDYAAWRGHLADLDAYDPASQTPQQQLSTRVLRWFIVSTLDGEPFRFHDYPVNQLFGVQNQTPEFLIHQHRIEDLRGAQDYLSRLGEFPRKFEQVRDGLVVREQRGIVPPRFVIERVLAEMREFAGKAVTDHPLYQNFAGKVQALPGLDASQKQELQARCAQAIERSVVPAYRTLIAFFEQQLPRATTDDGVWKLPEGDAYYRYRLRFYTTTNLSPQEVHDLGLSEVARIEAEMKAILTAQSQLEPGEEPGQALARFARDPRFFYPDTDAGRSAALSDYGRMLDEQLVRARAVIGVVPKAPIEVRRIPPFKEKTAPGAYYTPPAMDGTRPGIFFVNLRDMREAPRFAMRTTAVHEGVPGHHFQGAVAQEQTGLPTFRRLLPFTAYAEGWALYAEWLAVEMGLYKDDPYGDLGRLQAEMFRAVRLVVDTGIHYKRWTRQQAIDYMIEKTGMSEGEVVSEVERYIVDPGQACAYKVGMLRIRAARARAEKSLAKGFDAAAERAFHDVVLRNGSMPLEVLEEQVDAWIRSRQ